MRALVAAIFVVLRALGLYQATTRPSRTAARSAAPAASIAAARVGGACVNGTCQTCGGPGQACCAGGLCDQRRRLQQRFVRAVRRPRPAVLRRQRLLGRRLLRRAQLRRVGLGVSQHRRHLQRRQLRHLRRGRPDVLRRSQRPGRQQQRRHLHRQRRRLLGRHHLRRVRRCRSALLLGPHLHRRRRRLRRRQRQRMCSVCGGAGEPCCTGNSCSASGLACSDGECVTCGGPGEACCNGADCGSGCCDPSNRKCVANGSACTAGTACSNNTCPPPQAGMCGGTTAFAAFDKGCTTSDNCSDGFHQVDCCGSLHAIGFNHAQRDAFTAAETAWDATCAACGCAAQPTLAEDGKSCAMNAVTVTCDTGMCTTHCP